MNRDGLFSSQRLESAGIVVTRLRFHTWCCVILLFLFGAGCLVPAVAQRSNASSCITTFDVPGQLNTIPYAINDAGQIAGNVSAEVFSMLGPGFLRETDGTFTVFEVTGSSSTNPTSISASGQITGWYYDASFVIHGFLRESDGTIITFDPIGSGNTNPLSINPSGQITGWYYDASGDHGFLRQADGTIISFDPPGSINTYATSINPAGQIVGNFYDTNRHGFLREADGTFITIDATPPGQYSATFADAISPAGEIAGNFITYAGTGYTAVLAFLRESDGTIIKFGPNGLGEYPNGFGVYPISINAAGQIAGLWEAPPSNVGFLRESDGTEVFINPTNSFDTEVHSMNSTGQITGYYQDGINFQYYGFLVNCGPGVPHKGKIAVRKN
jgi:hypothetical protein